MQLLVLVACGAACWQQHRLLLSLFCSCQRLLQHPERSVQAQQAPHRPIREGSRRATARPAPPMALPQPFWRLAQALAASWQQRVALSPSLPVPISPLI